MIRDSLIIFAQNRRIPRSRHKFYILLSRRSFQSLDNQQGEKRIYIRWCIITEIVKKLNKKSIAKSLKFLAIDDKLQIKKPLCLVFQSLFLGFRLLYEFLLVASLYEIGDDHNEQDEIESSLAHRSYFAAPQVDMCQVSSL